jgi:hypothetical protein
MRSILGTRSLRHVLRRSLAGSRALVPIAAIAAAAGCTGKDPYSPGTKLGTFHVTAKLTHTSCGATPDPWEFDIRLNHEGSTLYWVYGDAPPIHGRVDESAQTQLEAQIVQEVRPADAKTKRDACTIARTDTLAIALTSSDAKPATDLALATSFVGGLVYTFAPLAGSECSDQLAGSGGDFDALPCEVRYDLNGTLTSPR